MRTSPSLLAAALAFTAFATPASAEPRLAAATPAAGTPATGVTQMRLTFNEVLTPKSSGATLVMTGMPGMANHPDMKMPGITAKVGADGKSIELAAAKPLPAGTYRIDWFATGRDKRRVTGQHNFSVR